jgi:hypothetical protein
MIEQAKSSEGERWIALMSKLTEGASDGTIASYPTDTTTHLQITWVLKTATIGLLVIFSTAIMTFFPTP